MRLALLVISGVMLLSATSVAEAAMYAYVDQSGSMHFTNVPADSRYREMPGFDAVKQAAVSGRYGGFIQTAADQYDLDPELIRAIIKVESGFNPFAVSEKGAMGLMQLMPATADEMQVDAPFEARENIMGGSKYLRKLLDMFQGDLRLSLAAYNAGPSRVLANGRVPRITETEQYVKKILREYNRSGAPSLAEQ